MVLLPLLAVGCASTEAASPIPVDPQACFREVATALSAEDMDGRGVGTPGLARAADYVAGRMAAFGLKPGVKSYKQPFTVTTGVTLGATNTLNDGAALAVGADWTPAGFARSGNVDADVVFAGFGITATDLGYDDYAGIDVKGKAVLVMRFEPGESDEKSVFDGKRASRHSDLRAKAVRAREAGAAALILVSPPATPDELDKLPPLKTLGPQSDAGIPVIFVSRAVADRWLVASGTTLRQARDTIDQSGKPASKALSAHVRAAVAVVPTRAESWNVVGVVRGRGALKDEVVVVGAHYDHLGHGGQGSFKPDVDAVHNGADDNASGVAGALCAAATVAQSPGAGDRRTLVFVAFSAEEIGLGGSAAYVAAPAVGSMALTTAMVNLDMVGRLREGKLNALGTDSSPAWAAVLEAAAKATPELAVTSSGDGYGPSDQTSFYAAGVPVVHLFTGAHDQYHTPDDDAPTLNIEGGGSIVRYTAAILGELVRDAPRPAYARSSAGAPGGDSRGYGAYFGSVPDYSAMEAATGGVKLSDVRAGSPAEKAGLTKGDVIVSMAGTTVNNLHDMTYVLREHRPGETVEVAVMRGATLVALKATLATRSPEAPKPAAPAFPPPADASALIRADEPHLSELRRLTFGGDNAEGYWAPDSKRIIFQRTGKDGGCDQEYVYDLEAGSMKLHSSGKGRTTCGYFDYPAGTSTLYATTEGASAECPTPPDHSQGYVWAVYDSFDMVRDDGTGTLTPWNAGPGYDAEATECHLDGRVVFTSTRNGDLDLYIANNDGSGLKQLTNLPGYDGGAFFTQDCKRIVWRASRPTGEALADYQGLLAKGLVRPTTLDLFVMDANGKNQRQITRDNVASFAPFPTPDGKGIVYSSNRGGNAREFDLWYVDWKGANPVRITTAPGFDGFPMFSPDGQWFAFSSNRANKEGERDTDLYVARWKP